MKQYMNDERPLPDLSKPGLWQDGQRTHAAAMARAGFALGQLDADLSTLSPDSVIGPETGARTGAIRRLALIEVSAILSACGRPLPPAQIAADLLDTAPVEDMQALRFARWAVRRLEGQGDTRDLRSFLGLYRATAPATRSARRPQAEDLDHAAKAFLDHLDGSDLHPLARGPYGRTLWRLASLSPADEEGEAAIWMARDAAADCAALPFAPLGRANLRLLVDSGPPADRMARHLVALEQAAQEARHHLRKVTSWHRSARDQVAHVKGHTPDRILAVLAAHPLLLTADVARRAGVSRITAERVLARLQAMGLIREATGAIRYRLWAAKLS